MWQQKHMSQRKVQYSNLFVELWIESFKLKEQLQFKIIGIIYTVNKAL